MQEYYFHFDQENIFSMNFNRGFEYLRLLGSFNYNSFGESNISSLIAGGQIRPTDTLGFAMLKQLDLRAGTNIRTDYSLDIMPHNDCWILTLNYRDGIRDSRYFFNVLFNFGDEKFSQYRSNYFGVAR